MLGLFTLFIFVGMVLLGCSENTDEDVAANEAENYPTQPITLVVPFDSGSVTDLFARMIAERLSESLDTPVIIENLPGGGTIPGHVQVAQANSDGYTLGIGALAVEITLHGEESTISSLDDLDSLVQLGEYTTGISVSADSDIESIEDLQDLDEQITVAPAAAGSINHLYWDLVAEHYGVEDYGLMSTTGGNDAVLKLLSGDADVVSTPLANVVEHVESGDVRLLALTTSDTVPGMEDIPTIEELGIDNPLTHNLLLIAPEGLPEGVREVLINHTEEIVSDPEVQEEMENMELIPTFLKGEELDNQINEGREAIHQILDGN